MEIYAIHLFKDEVSKEAFDNLLGLVSIQKRERIGKFRFREDALRALTADLLVRSVICKTYGIKNQDLHFHVNDYGKPYLDNISIHYNVSHSGDWVVGAFDVMPVGIDVERIRKIDLNVAKRFFAETEYQALLKKDKEAQTSFFYDLWTLKESYIKTVGKGLSIPLDSFAMIFENSTIRVESKEDNNTYSFKQYSIDKEYKMSVCTQGGNPSEKVVFTDIHGIGSNIL